MGNRLYEIGNILLAFEAHYACDLILRRRNKYGFRDPHGRWARRPKPKLPSDADLTAMRRGIR